MTSYLILKHIHMTAAYLTITLFALRLALDGCGRSGWRQGPLRWVPHVNDTVLLLAAVGLVVVSGWMPFVHHWLTLKIVLLLGYIAAGAVALNPQRTRPVRWLASLLALAQVGLIVVLAKTKPLLFGA
ncbi:SirB2 family protein [Marinobacter mobilis]|uniref:SirB2 family protein n=1 Tax=Marinobacter mobilis TaxID=488533 RepID=UPI0035C7778A